MSLGSASARRPASHPSRDGAQTAERDRGASAQPTPRGTRARGCLVRLRPLGPAAGSIALLTFALAPAGLGTDVARPVEHAWGGAPEPALHRLLRDLVGEAHEHDAARSPRR